MGDRRRIHIALLTWAGPFDMNRGFSITASHSKTDSYVQDLATMIRVVVHLILLINKL